MSDTTPVDRLRLLRETGVISEPVRLALDDALMLLRDAFGPALEGDTGQMLVTHLAMAAQRATDGELLETAPANVAEALEGREGSLRLAEQTLGAVERSLGITFPQAEVQLVAIYLATLSESEPQP